MDMQSFRHVSSTGFQTGQMHHAYSHAPLRRRRLTMLNPRLQPGGGIPPTSSLGEAALGSSPYTQKLHILSIIITLNIIASYSPLVPSLT